MKCINHKLTDYRLLGDLYKLVGEEDGYKVKCIYLTNFEVSRLTGKGWKDISPKVLRFYDIPIKERKYGL